MSTRRFVSIQHGDYAAALRTIRSGENEPYFGMGYTLNILADLFGGDPHLVISLNAPTSREIQGKGKLVGIPLPHLPFLLPGRLAELIWAHRILSEIKRFQPTHVLVRTGGPRAIAILKYCIRHELSTAVIFANTFDNKGGHKSALIKKIVPLLNNPCVVLVGNHKQPATDSMLECGLDPSKAAAWDWPNAMHPKEVPEKKLVAENEHLVLYVGKISKSKGVSDLIEAARLLKNDLRIRFIAVGDGPEIEALRAAAATIAEGSFQFLGRLPNSETFKLMKQASIVCVPSHHAFSEGMPLTLTEALASRTPTVISDHPVFLRAFRDGEGLRIVPEKNPGALAKAVHDLLSNPNEYAKLSNGTLNAFERVECKTSFGDLINRWKSTF